MGKFRSKLKKKAGTKSYPKNQSSTSNPTTNKHRAKATSRFFHANLNSETQDGKKPNLTFEAVMKHDALQSGPVSIKQDPRIGELAGSLRTFSMNDDDDYSESHGGTMKSFQSFASNFSACTNMSFAKLIENFSPNSQIQKEMLAILAALTEIIKEKGGAENSTEYFLVLMETIEAATDDDSLIAALTLLSMGIKSVPEAVLRKKFNDTAQILLQNLQKFVESEHRNVIRSILSSLSVLLRAQEYSQWNLSSTYLSFDAILSIVVHSKPKIRKSAQHSIASILFKSCFMKPKTNESNEEITSVLTKHPAENRVAQFCLEKFTADNIANNQTLVLHIINFLQSVMSAFSTDNIKKVSENLLSIMSSTNLLIRTCCFQTFYQLFNSKSKNLTETVVGKLISALKEFQPDKNDARQILAWLTVMKQAYIVYCTGFNEKTAINAVHGFFNTVTTDIWLSNRPEVVSGASNALKEILEECVLPICSNGENVEASKGPIKRIIEILTKALLSPFDHAAKHLLVLFGVLFKACGKHFGNDFREALKILGSRYDDQSNLRIHLEHAVLSAISTIDINIITECIPLTEKSGVISLNRSWMLPLLREGLENSSLEFFNNYILKLAYQCYKKWQLMKEEKIAKEAHIYELLCCQLWGLFPGFCRHPADIENFKLIAKTLGTVLNDNPDLRPSILDGLKELLSCDEQDRQVLAPYAKNYLPRMFNIYTTKPTMSYENEIRLSCFEVIQKYLEITPKPVLDHLFDTGLEQLESQKAGTFMYDTLFDIIEAMAVYQTKEKIQKLYTTYIVAILKSETKMETTKFVTRRKTKKAYLLLHNLLKSENEECIEFIELNLGNIEKLVMNTSYKTIEGTQLHRLLCLKLLIEKRSEKPLEEKLKLIKMTISEVLAAFNNEAVIKEKVHLEILKILADAFVVDEKINEFIDLLIAGLVGDNTIISNTILSLKFVINEYQEDIESDTLKFIIDQVLEFVVSNQRNVVDASLNFLITAVKTLPVPLIYENLPIIVKALTIMAPDPKRYCRLTLGFLLKRLCKKFTAEEIIRLVPGSDELMHKRLKKIKKEMARAKRNRQAKDKEQDDDDEEDEFGDLEKKTETIDEILSDSSSDSEMELDEEEKTETKANKKSKSNVCIQEDPDSIVDLADFNEFSKVTSSATSNKKLFEKKNKDKNRGFKTAADGRLIIKDIEDNSSDEEDVTGFVDESKKRVYDEESENEDGEEISKPSSSKKIAMDKKSNASKMSSKSTSYVAGGKGIHRPTAVSVKSGISSNSKSTAFGKEYQAKKAGGDMKRKGKLEPHAYIPMSRGLLNRRNKTKGSLFKGVIKKRKVSAAGSKNRLLKKK